MASNLERAFETRWEQYWRVRGGLMSAPALTPQYHFHEDREWAFDFAFPDVRIAIELEGGVFTGGRHTRGIGFTEDCYKYNAATADGWAILRYTAGMLEDDPMAVCEQITKLMLYRAGMMRGLLP